MVAVSFEGLEGSGALEDCYVSLRTGEGVQRLSRMSGKRHIYNFPEVGKDHQYGKIEIYRRIGSCSLQLEPLAGLRQMQLSSREPAFSGLRLQVSSSDERETKHDTPKLEARKKSSLQAATDYLNKHSIQGQLSAAMKAVLQEKPENPAEFIAARLLGHSDGRLPPMHGKRASTSTQDSAIPLPPGRPGMQRGRQQRGKKLPPLQAVPDEPQVAEPLQRDSLNFERHDKSENVAALDANELKNGVSTSSYPTPSEKQPLPTSSTFCEIAPVASEDTDSTRLSELKAQAGYELASAMRSGALNTIVNELKQEAEQATEIVKEIKQETDQATSTPPDGTRRIDELGAQAGNEFATATQSGTLETFVEKLALCEDPPTVSPKDDSAELSEQLDDKSTEVTSSSSSLDSFPAFYRSHFRGSRAVESLAQKLFGTVE